MRAKHWFAPPVAAALLGGCAVLPTFPREGAVQSDAIVHHVQCELQAAHDNLRPKYALLQNWAAGYKLTYRTEAQHSGGLASGTWAIPGGVSVGAAATVGATGVRQGLVKYQTDFKDIGAVECPLDRDESRGRAGFKGDLGIEEWLDAALASSLRGGRAPRELTYVVSFVARYDASLRPTFSIVNLTGTPVLGGSRINSDTLDIAFVDVTQTPPKPPKPIPVYIVEGPGGAPMESLAAPAAAPDRGALPPEVQDRLDELLDNQ